MGALAIGGTITGVSYAGTAPESPGATAGAPQEASTLAGSELDKFRMDVDLTYRMMHALTRWELKTCNLAFDMTRDGSANEGRTMDDYRRLHGEVAKKFNVSLGHAVGVGAYYEHWKKDHPNEHWGKFPKCSR